MTVQELKTKVESYRESLKEKKGKPCMWGDGGPVSLSVIEALIATIETQQKQIDDLERGARVG